jgi:ATP-dependent DNA helicase PIF1
MSFEANDKALRKELDKYFPIAVIDLILYSKGVEFHTVTDPVIHEVFCDKDNMFITGAGGTGKSYQLKSINDYCLYNDIKIGLTSTTGKSALSIGGTTIHHWSGIKTGEQPIEKILKYINSNDDAKRRWKEYNILVIDEVSMLGASVLDKLDKIGQVIRRDKRPFGGMQIIFSGDFLQLRPIKDEFSFKSKVWDKLNLTYLRLNTPHRFTDKSFHRMLMRIRKGEPTSRDIKKLKSRLFTYDEIQDMNSDIKPTMLFSRKADVYNVNEEELEEINKPLFVYKCRDKIVYKKKSDEKLTDTDLLVSFKNILDKSVDVSVSLKVGAQVMLTYNIDIPAGLVNGTRGIITDCMHSSAEVQFDNGLKLNIGYNDWSVEADSYTVVRQQIPLILAWAITLHKSQGATISKVVTSLSYDIFTAGMAYLALSRCRNLESIFLLEFNPRKIYANKEALEFEQKMEE